MQKYKKVWKVMLFMKKNFKIFSKEGAPARSKQLHSFCSMILVSSIIIVVKCLKHRYLDNMIIFSRSVIGFFYSKTTCFGVVVGILYCVGRHLNDTKTSCFAFVIYYPLFRNEDSSGSNPYRERLSTIISLSKEKSRKSSTYGI
jgi:hypothetical protein